MNKQLIRDLAITGGIYDCICDPYDKLENGDYYSSVMVDLERFAEKIVRECDMVLSKDDGATHHSELLFTHFGVEERKGWVCPKCGVDRTRDVCPKGHMAAATGDCPMIATAHRS